MSKIHITLMFRALVNERLIAAAEEIFGIVDRTITEEVSRSRQETFYQQSKHCHINPSPSVSGFEDGDARERQCCEQERSPCLKEQQPGAAHFNEEHHIKEEHRDGLWSSQMLRTLVNECLTAAAEEIFGVFDRTLAEYEEGLSRSKQEKVRHRRKPEITLRRADVQRIHACEEEDPSEQHHCEWGASPIMQQERPEPARIKEEREELWSAEGGEEPEEEEEEEEEEEDIIKFVLPHVDFRNDRDEGEDERFPGAPPQPMAAGPDGVDFGESEPPDDHSHSSEDGESDGDWQESGDPQLSGCRLCGKTFRYRGCLLKHILQTHASNTECLCGVCGQLLESTDSLRLHLQTHSCDRAPKPRHRPVCHLCGKSVKVMKYHMRIHTGEKPYSCKTCGTQFVRNSDLTRHMSIHTGERPYSCTLCEKRFTRSNDVVRHMSTHEGVAPYKPYGCAECGMDFSRRRSLNEHMMTHTGEKLCSCEICGEGFTRSDGLKRHMRIHTGETPFNCGVCGAGFTRRDTLRNHRKIHSGKEPLSCTECNIEFNHRRSLTVHMRKHRADL